MSIRQVPGQNQPGSNWATPTCDWCGSSGVIVTEVVTQYPHEHQRFHSVHMHWHCVVIMLRVAQDELGNDVYLAMNELLGFRSNRT